MVRKIYYLFSFALVSFYCIFFLQEFQDFKNFVNSQYVKFKNFVFLLENVKPTRKRYIDEKTIRRIASAYGLEVKEISKTENGYLIYIKNLNAFILPKLLREFEKYSEIESFEAVDNTGKGIFDFKIILRTF